MKRLWFKAAFLAVPLLALVVWSGCAGPRIDWDNRIGNYTYDQAVLELGPPDKAANLSDGMLVADWFTRGRAGPQLSFGLGTGFYGRRSAVTVGQSVGTSPPPQYLRLTFDTQGTMVSWRRN
jgi:hypothetical protein